MRYFGVHARSGRRQGNSKSGTPRVPESAQHSNHNSDKVPLLASSGDSTASLLRTKYSELHSPKHRPRISVEASSNGISSASTMVNASKPLLRISASLTDRAGNTQKKSRLRRTELFQLEHFRKIPERPSFGPRCAASRAPVLYCF